MEEHNVIMLKNICCTCLCRDRKLYQLCRISNGINNLYLLLSLDVEAYREGFYKDAVNLYICWECRAIFKKLSSFRQRVCMAQKKLIFIDNGRARVAHHESLSSLSTCILTEIHTYIRPIDNFIDCGDNLDIKDEKDVDDIFLSKIKVETNFNSQNPEMDDVNERSDSLEDIYVDDKTDDNILNGNLGDDPLTAKSNKTVIDLNKIIKNTEFETVNSRKWRGGYKRVENNFKIIIMDEFEMLESRQKRKSAANFTGAVSQCYSCIEVFKSQLEYEIHNDLLHKAKPDLVQCKICLSYVHSATLKDHTIAHYHKYLCQICQHTSYSNSDIYHHLRNCHHVKGASVKQNKFHRWKFHEVNPGSKSRNPNGYKCPECDESFKNQNTRYKHVRRYHREGYECDFCGKKFHFKDYLAKHIRRHNSPLPRSECETCHKMVRTDLMKHHVLIHSNRQKYSCVECDKTFVCRGSYQNHLKYSKAHHSTIDVLKHKCSRCDKGYRSKAELEDHYNYQHLGKTHHNCPICGKALATRRCILRHVKRAHEDIKEGVRDKICQQCGKAFRDKKCLREHELIHTGERPLSCEICGCTFRQQASLYTHRKRVHKIYVVKKSVELVKPP